MLNKHVDCVRHAAAVRHLALWLAALTLLGCGGGGSTPPTPPDPAPPPTPSAGMFSSAAHRPSAGMFALNLYDPATPTSLALTVDFGTTSPSLQNMPAIRIDGATGSATALPSPWLIYVREQRLFQIDLSLSKIPSPVAVAGVADACSVEGLYASEAAGRSGLAVISIAGADGDCATSTDNRRALLRVGETPSPSATLLPAETISIGSRVVDSEGRLLWLLGMERVDRPLHIGGTAWQLVAYKPNLERVLVENGVQSSGSFSYPNAGPLSAGLWAKRGVGAGQLVHLTGNADTLRLVESFPTVGGWGDSYFGPMVDQGIAYEVSTRVDGLIRVAADGGTQALGSLDPTAGRVTDLSQNASYLLVLQRTSAGAQTWTVVRKSDGSSRTLLTRVASSQAEWVALGETRLLYRTQADQGNGELRAIDLASGNDVVVLGNIVHPQLGALPRVTAASWTRSAATGLNHASAVLVCRPTTANGDCRNSELLQVDVNSGDLLVLGKFADASTSARISLAGFAVMGQAGSPLTLFAIGTPSTSRVSDTYSVEPGRAASLRRVTNVIQ